jgi:hypothetical protein
MAYLEGESLSMRLARGRLPVNEAIELARTIADALAEAHRAGIVHRDLKPANILFDRNGRPVVADFGLSRNVALAAGDSLTGQSIVGTPAYMSPEQINGETDRIGPPTDVYALGVVLYEMLTGARPFEGSLGTLLGKIATADPSSPSELRPEIDERLNAICLRALARSPSERFQTMTEFSSALGEAAGPASRRKQVTRRLALAGSLGLVLVGVIVAVIALSRDPTGSPNAQPVDPVNPPVIAAPKGNLRLLVPAYFSPTGSGAVHWDSLIRTASSNHIVIINVDDGPGSNADANWARVIERLQSAGATAIGYVGTNYGKVSLARVKRHIDDWHRFYPAIGGIFFEEQAATAGRADYYVQAAKHARAKNAKSLVVSNPGDHCDRAYFECRDIDIVCVIESGKEYHLELPDWMPRDFPDKLAGMIYEVDSARRMEERMAELTAGGVRSLYLSDTKEDEHFSRLPPWWNELVQAAAK